MLAIPTWTLPFLYVVVILGLTAVIAWVAGFAIGRLMRSSAPQVAASARRIGTAVVWVVGLLSAVQEAGLSVEVLLVIVVLVGLATIVALREPLENFGAKYFSDVYSPFTVGDEIQVGEYSGRVIEINSMSTVMLSEDDRLIALPNALLMREVLINSSPQAWKKLALPISLPPGIELAAAESEILKSLSKLRARLDKRIPPALTVRARTPQSVDLVLTVMIRRPEERESILLEINKRVHDALQKTRGRGGDSTSPRAPAPKVPEVPEVPEGTPPG